MSSPAEREFLPRSQFFFSYRWSRVGVNSCGVLVPSWNLTSALAHASTCLCICDFTADLFGRCVAVKTLPLNTDVEIECIAVL
jgi:hypothetical protein